MRTRQTFVALFRTTVLITLWIVASGTGKIIQAQAPTANIKVWNITTTIGHNPDESVEDIAGITGHVATLANPQTIATTIENTTHPEGPCGLIFWNPATNSFKWYGISGGFSAGIDLNLRAPLLTGPVGSVFGAPTFQPGDVWVAINGGSPPIYVNFKGSNNFRFYPVGGANGVQVDQTTGKIYFTDLFSGTINRLDPATNAVTTWTVGGSPHYLAIDSTGRVYSAVARATVAGGVDAIVRIDPAAATNNVTSWVIPGGGLTLGLSFQTPDGVSFDTAGNLWFTESTSNEIGRLNPSTGEICEFTKAGISNPQLVASSGSGSLLQTFFTEGTGNAVSVVTQAAAVPIASPCPTQTPSVNTMVAPGGFSVSFSDSIRTPRGPTTITPLPVSVSGVDGTPGVVRFPMPTPMGGNAAAPNFPSGMTGVVLPTTVFGSYLDPSFAGNSAVFQVSSAAIIAPPPAACQVTSIEIDRRFSNGVIDVSATDSACQFTVTITNLKSYWTNFRVDTVGLVVIEPVGGDLNLYAKFGILAPTKSVSFRARFSQPGQAISIFADPTVETGIGAGLMNIVQAIINTVSIVFPAGAIDLGIEDAAQSLQAFDQMPHLKSAAVDFFQNPPNFVNALVQLEAFVRSEEPAVLATLLVQLGFDIGKITLVKLLQRPGAIANALTTIVGNFRTGLFGYPAGSATVVAR